MRLLIESTDSQFMLRLIDVLNRAPVAAGSTTIRVLTREEQPGESQEQQQPEVRPAQTPQFVSPTHAGAKCKCGGTVKKARPKTPSNCVWYLHCDACNRNYNPVEGTRKGGAK